MESCAILYSDDAALCARITRLLKPHRWRVRAGDDAGTALAWLDESVALVVLDARTFGAQDFVADLRAQSRPAAGAPIIQYGGERLIGSSALPSTIDADAIERFTGALPDHALRRAPYSPFYRLVRLLGTYDAAAMVDRFAETLRATLAEGAASSEQAHRLAGLAGAIGFSELALAWCAAEHGDAQSNRDAMTATRATLAEIDHDDLARYRGVAPRN